MTPLDIQKLRQIDTFDSLIAFLRDELDWPLDGDEIDDLSFEYNPTELGLSDDVAVKIHEIKQMRPLAAKQPWGIFYIDFEPKQLPVVVLRRILQKLVISRRSSRKSNLPGWKMHDLLFINSYGLADERTITFAHFKQEEDNLPTLKVIGSDGTDTPLHLNRCKDELGYLRFDPDAAADQWRETWSKAFTTVYRHSITTSKKLAQTLAALAKEIRKNAEHILKYETKNGPFQKRMAKFKAALIHDLTEEDFADMYAQTIAYGLLYTAIRSHVKGEGTVVSSKQLQQLVLPTNPFLKEVMEDFFNIGGRKWDSEKEKITGLDFDELGINDIIATLKDKKTDFDAILRDFGNETQKDDPVIYFYELFLKEYDALIRKSRGVYYTPQPVVSFIVRSVHEILIRDFGLPLGLASDERWKDVMKKNPQIKLPKGVSKDDFFVQILDVAVGTGTFIVEVIDLIYKTIVSHLKSLKKSDSEIADYWKHYVPNCLLKRLYGFELMMAPYAIAHMRIGIKLYETGYRNFAKDKQRVQVYLTNTLQQAVDTKATQVTLEPAIAEETKHANEVKESNSITVVIGNPPYAGHSFNNDRWIHLLLRTKLADGADSYFNVDGGDLGERNPKWLNDDYVKFIRYSQFKLANAGAGVFGFITNHAYLDNPTFRGMRQSLIHTYDQIDIIDLHGSAKKKEKAPDGSKDDNIFNIQQGVAINISTKLDKKKRKFNHSDIWGAQQKKYIDCKNHDCFNIPYKKLFEPVSDMYLFCKQEQNVRDEYDEYQKIASILQENVLGFQTHRDSFVITYEYSDIYKRISEMRNNNIDDNKLKTKYGLEERGS